MNPTIDNVLIRLEVKELFRKNRKVAILLFIIYFGVTMALSLLPSVIVTPNDLLIVTTNTATTYEEPVILTNEATAGASVISLLLSLAASFITAPLMLGTQLSYLRIVRGETVAAKDAFCRMNTFLKAVGLQLFIGLKVFLWALPSIAIVALCSVLAFTMGDNGGVLLSLLPLIAAISVFCCVIPAAFRYALATFFMAECPERGIRSSVALSKQAMKGRKWQYFKLPIPFLLKDYGMLLLLTLAASLVLGIIVSMLTAGLGELPAIDAVMSIIVSVVAMLPSLWYLPQMALASAKFYDLVSRREQVAGETAEPAASSADEAAVPEAAEYTVE